MRQQQQERGDEQPHAARAGRLRQPGGIRGTRADEKSSRASLCFQLASKQPSPNMLPLNVPSSLPQRRPTPNASKAAAGPCQAKDPNAFRAKPDPSAQAKDAAKARLVASSRGRAAAKQFGNRANPRSEAAIRERVRAEMRAEEAASKERALKEWQIEEEQHGQTPCPGRLLRLLRARPASLHSREVKAGPLGAQLLPRLLEPAASNIADSTAFI